MRILSLNVNDFGGNICLQELKSDCATRSEAYRVWDSLDKTREMKAIFEYIVHVKAAQVVILQEFELNTAYAGAFLQKMDSAGYEVVPYGTIGNYKRPSITIMLIQKGLPYLQLPNPHRLKTEKTLRANIVRCADFIIYGVHAPYDEDFWDELMECYDLYTGKKSEKMVVIGDMNVNLYAPSNAAKEKFLQLTGVHGAIDAWAAQGKRDNEPTYWKNRIDYALMSPAAYALLADIQIDPSLWKRGMTDHAALIVDVSLEGQQEAR